MQEIKTLKFFTGIEGQTDYQGMINECLAEYVRQGWQHLFKSNWYDEAESELRKTPIIQHVVSLVRYI